MPATRPSAGLSLISSSRERRRRWPARVNAPYSMKLSASHKSATFSRAVRCPRFLQVRADRVEVYGLRLLHTLTAGIERLDEQQWLPGRYCLSFRHQYLAYHTIGA